jgi:hypothetical protein
VARQEQNLGLRDENRKFKFRKKSFEFNRLWVKVVWIARDWFRSNFFDISGYFIFSRFLIFSRANFKFEILEKSSIFPKCWCLGSFYSHVLLAFVFKFWNFVLSKIFCWFFPHPKKNLPKFFCSRGCSDRRIFWKILLLHKNIFCTRARIHSLQINIFGLERIFTLPEEYLRQ